MVVVAVGCVAGGGVVGLARAGGLPRFCDGGHFRTGIAAQAGRKGEGGGSNWSDIKLSVGSAKQVGREKRQVRAA